MKSNNNNNKNVIIVILIMILIGLISYIIMNSPQPNLHPQPVSEVIPDSLGKKSVITELPAKIIVHDYEDTAEKLDNVYHYKL